MPYLDLPSHRLHYRIDGVETDGVGCGKPWLLFCNSLGTDLTMWDAQIPALARDFRILRHDTRGHGLSGTPPGRYDLADLGGDVIALLDALAIPRLHVCGLSIGGLTGQWLGLHAAARVDRLALCATAARIGSAEGWAARIRAVARDGLGALVDATARRWFSPGFAAAQPHAVAAILNGFAATPVEGYLGCCAALAEADLTAQSGGIARPVLAVSGADDPVCPPVALEALARAVRHGRHRMLPGRHLVSVESAPAFNALLRDFLIEAPIAA